MKRKFIDSFWITNISKKAVHISDLAVIIYPFRSINLLDKKHYNFVRSQLEKSQNSGSLKNKKSMVVVRLVPPDIEAPNYLPFQDDAIYPNKPRSAHELDNIKYDELDVSDDVYAEENADTAENDHLGKWKK